MNIDQLRMHRSFYSVFFLNHTFTSIAFTNRAFAVLLAASLIIAGLTPSHLNAESFKPISNYEAEYKFKSSKYKISAKAIRKLTVDKDLNTVLTQQSKIMIANVSQRSEFKLDPSSCTIIAESYSYKRKVFGKKTDYRVKFDQNKRQFFEVKDNKSQTISFNDELYDELSYQEALRCELLNNPGVTVGQRFDYMVRTKGKNKAYRFEVSAIETIDTGLGKVETVKISRIRDSKDGKSNSHIWFSKEHNYLFLKFRQSNKDDKYSLDIKKVNLNP